MANFLWWRSWHGAPMDNKWPVIAARAGVKVGIVSAIVWALMDYSSQQNERGSVDGFDTEVYAVYSGFEEDEIKKVIQALKDKEVIIDGKLAKWEKRQPNREDDSGDRVRKFRENKRSVTQCNADVTQCNASNENVTIDSLSLSLSDSLSNSVNRINSLNKDENIFRIYETEIGALTPTISEILQMEQEDNPSGWVEDAIKEASKSNKRSVKYVQGILRNWREKGRSDTPKTEPPKKKDDQLCYVDIDGKRQIYQGSTLLRTEPIPNEAMI